MVVMLVFRSVSIRRQHRRPRLKPGWDWVRTAKNKVDIGRYQKKTKQAEGQGRQGTQEPVKGTLDLSHERQPRISLKHTLSTQATEFLKYSAGSCICSVGFHLQILRPLPQHAKILLDPVSINRVLGILLYVYIGCIFD